MISGPIVSAQEAVRLFGRAVFLDARAETDASAGYARGHVAGARFVDLERDLSAPHDPESGGRHPLPRLERWRECLGRWGIDPSTQVLIYDAQSGGMAAARAWWMLRAIGHASVAVVEGGWASLSRTDIPVEKGAPIPLNHTGPPYPSTADVWPVVDAEFVDRVRRDPEWRLIDARAPERYAGEVEPIDPVAGHIEGAVNHYWKSQIDAQGALHDRDALRRRFHDLLGETPPERVVCYCGSGVTACHVLLAMDACGLKGAHLYVGSWSEWCRTRGGAIATR